MKTQESLEEYQKSESHYLTLLNGDNTTFQELRKACHVRDILLAQLLKAIQQDRVIQITGPKDVIVVEVPGAIPQATAERLKDYMQQIWPNHQCVVLGDGLHLRIVQDFR